MIHKIHHVGIVVRDLEEALRYYRDTLGLPVQKQATIEEQAVTAALLPVGDSEIELIQPITDDSGVARYLASRGEGFHHLCFEVDDIEQELARLQRESVQLIDQQPRLGLAGRIAFLHPRATHGVLVELAQPTEAPHPSQSQTPLKRIDHVAALVRDLDTAQATWRKNFGLTVRAVLDYPDRGMRLAQIPAGDAIVELLVPTAPESPLAQRIEQQGEGMTSSISLEVDDLDQAVARFRNAGLEIAGPQDGVLPGTRIATITARHGHGVAIQLLQYI